MGVNLVLLDKVFFSAVSCSSGVPEKESRECPMISLEQFEILTFHSPIHLHAEFTHYVLWMTPCNVSPVTDIMKRYIPHESQYKTEKNGALHVKKFQWMSER
jgi:hypothetical protein